MVKEEGVTIITEREARVIKSDDAPTGLTEELQKLFFESLSHITMGQMGEELAKLEEKKMRGELTAKDLPILSQLGVVYQVKQGQLQEDVAKVFGLALSGNKKAAERLAGQLIIDGADKLPPTNKLTISMIKSLKSIALTGIETTSKLANGELSIKLHGEKAEAALVVAHRVVEKGRGLREDIALKSGSNDILARGTTIAEQASKYGAQDLSNEIDQAIQQNRRKMRQPFESAKMDIRTKKELLRRLGKKRAGKELTTLLTEDKPRIIELISQVNRDKEASGRRALEDFGERLRIGRRTLETDRITQALKPDKKHKLDVHSSIKLKIGDWELGLPKIPAGATKHERLRKVLEIVDTSEDAVWSEEQKIALVAQVMGGISTERASAIWGEAKRWDSNYTSFVEHVEGIADDIENVLRPPVKEQKKKEEMFDLYREQMLDNRYRGRGAGKRGVMQAGPDDEDTKYNEYGRQIAELLGKEYELKIEVGVDSKGRKIYRSQTNSEFWEEQNAAGYQIPPGMNRSYELSVITGGRKYRDIPENERVEIANKVKDAIRDIIGRIQATEDSSRAPNNQPLSWEVNDLMSWLDSREDANFRSLMQARLASYDQSTILGSIGKKDQFEQVASFIPREWVALLQKDENTFGKYIDVDGNLQSYNLCSQDIYTELEDTIPGSGDRENTWYTEIRKPENMELVGLAKRRFMAFLLGKQRGVEFEFTGDGSIRLVDNTDNLARAKSTFGEVEGNIFQEVGLDMNGNFMTDEEYRRFEKYDLFKIQQSFINQSLTRKEIELRGMALEKGQMLNQGINAFRKMYGWEQLNYTAVKFMGMTSSRGDVRDGQVVGGVDDKWRSLPAWKLMSKADNAEYLILKPLSDAYDRAVPRATSSQKDKFFLMFEHLAYLPERFYLGKLVNQPEHGYGGELRMTAEVRHMFDDEFAEVERYFTQIDGFAQMDWKEILKAMNVSENKMRNGTKGVGGLKLFCQNYNLDRLMDYNRLPQNFWVDFISYSGYSAKNWDQVSSLVTNMADPKLQIPFVDGIRGYDDGAANATFTEFTAKTLKEVSADPAGYMSWGDKEGKQTTKKWKIISGDTSEVEYAQSWGFRVLTDGRVVDRNGRFVARPIRVSALKNIIERDGGGKLKIASLRDLINTVKGWGSPYLARARTSPSWEDKRDYIFKSLREMKITDEIVWRDVHARFNAGMYFGVQIEPHENPDMKTIIAKLKKEPWKIALLPYTIVRGLYTDAPIDLASIIAAWNPLSKQVNRIFEI